jgi:hypothetical protein
MHGGKIMAIRKYIVTLTSKEREHLTRLVSNGQDGMNMIVHYLTR